MPLSKTQFGNSGRRNKIINGAMQVAQRGTSGTVTAGNSGYIIDRFQVSQTAMDELVSTVTQESDGPSGFSNSLKVKTTTIEQAVATGEYSNIRYAFEGKDLQQLEYGTATAKSFVLSFWVKSSNTGNFGITAYKKTGGSNDRQQERQYTINTADTWERKSLVFAGETMSSREIDNAVTMGLALYWHIEVNGISQGTGTYNGATGWQNYSDAQWGAGHDIGSNNMSNTIVGVLNKYIQITGVQLEVGDVSTEFEHRPYTEVFRECARYYQIRDIWVDQGSTSSGTDSPNYYYTVPLNPEMNHAPDCTFSEWGSQSGNFTTRHGSTVVNGGVKQGGNSNMIYFRGNHSEIWNYAHGRIQMDSEI